VLGKGFVLVSVRLGPYNFDSSLKDFASERMVGEIEICEMKSSG